MMWKKQLGTQSIAEQQLQMSSFPIIGELCLTPPDTPFAYVK